MKIIQTFKIVLLLLALFLLIACAATSRVGSSDDTSGTNGATNGTGKIPRSNNVHHYK